MDERPFTSKNIIEAYRRALLAKDAVKAKALREQWKAWEGTDSLHKTANRKPEA